mmetsp:Transcript_4690/g.8543  ORF Transcript_4690/g.8543 Transcript_4690/m.8543 type:complete len:206 (+) Transcript_4690:363-980(+)
MVGRDLANMLIEGLQDSLQLLQVEGLLAAEDRRHVDSHCLRSAGVRGLALCWGWRSTLTGLRELLTRELQDVPQSCRNQDTLTLVCRPGLCQESINGSDGTAILLDNNQVFMLHRILPDGIIIIDVHDWNQDVRDESEESLIQGHRWPALFGRILLARMLAHGPRRSSHQQLQVMSASQPLRQKRPSVTNTCSFFEPGAHLLPVK